MKRKTLSVIIAFAVVLLLVYGLNVVYAVPSVTEQKEYSPPMSQSTNIDAALAPTYSAIESSEISKKTNQSMLDQILHQMAEYKKEIASLGTFEPTEEFLDWPPEPVFVSEITHYYAGPEYGNAVVDNAQNLIGASDLHYAHLHVEEYRPIPYTDEAFIFAEMEDMAIGNVWLTGYSGSGYEVSEVDVMVSNSSEGGWTEIGQTHVLFTENNTESLCAGYASFPFKYVVIFCWSQDGEHERHDAYVDEITAGACGPANDLTISIGAGSGTTDPEPGTHGYYGETVEVTAIPDEYYAFDHWLLDSEQSTENPIYVDMYDGSHELEAYFAYTAWQNLTITCGSGGTTDPTPDTYSYEYGETASVTAEPNQGSSFSYWIMDGEYVYTDNPIGFGMWSGHTLEAHFNEQLPTCELTVLGHWAGGQLETNVYIDSQWTGVTDDTFYVQVGTHYIEVENPVQTYWYFHYYYVEGNYNYENPMELELYQLHLTITAEYVGQK